MKKRRILLGLAVATAFIGATTACGSSKDTSNAASTAASSAATSSVDQDAINTEKAEAALAQATVASTVTADFTLKTSGNGGVTIVWTSSNSEVIAISGGKATVKQSFTEDLTVTLTATATISGETYATKTFTVTVSKLEDQSKTVTEIKALDADTEIYAKGVVSGYLYASGTTDAEYKTGFYLTDSTGTIYVYGNLAQSVDVGDQVYLSGKVGEYGGAKQIASPVLLATLAENQAVDWSAVEVLEDDNALNTAITNSENIGKTFEALVQVYMNSYGSYSIEPIDYDTYGNSFGEYFSGSSSTSLTQYASLLRGYEGRALRVIFYVNSASSSGKLRGNVLAVKDLTAEDQMKTIQLEMDAAVALDSLITSSTEITLPTSFDRYPGYSVSWELATGSASAAITNGKLVVTAGTSVEKFTLVGTTSYTTTEDVYTAQESLTGFVDGTTYYTLADGVYTAVAADATFDSATTYYTLEEDKEVTKEITATDTASVIALDSVTFSDLATFVAAVKAGTIKKGDAVFVKGVVTNIDSSGNIFISDGTNEFELYKGVSEDSVVAADDIALGKTISLVGTYSPYNGVHETAQGTANVVKCEDSSAADLTAAAAGILTDIEAAYTSAVTNKTLSTTSTLSKDITISWEVVTETTAVTITGGKLNITLPDTAATVVIKATATLGEVTGTHEYTTSIYDSTTAILQSTVTTNTTAAASTTAGTLETDLGLDSTVFTATYDKNGASSELAIRTDGIRLYATKSTTNGNKLTITANTGYTIDKITIKFDSATDGACAVIYGADGSTAITGTDGVYTINGSAFTIYDDNSSVTKNTQVRFQSILIEYSAMVKI
ncbi:MAG: hypothetical protein K6A63_03195 [Acholeplasmatales bacterium]|nr:hypothetical protein [Acholeplasmatales bacterium]